MKRIFYNLVFCLIQFATTSANAHAFGQRYDLPLPLDIFIWGGAATVILSFLIAAFFVKHSPQNEYPRINLLGNIIGKFITHHVVIEIIRFCFAILFLVIIIAGFFGDQNPSKNVSVVMVWVIAWVGLAFICSLLGNFWSIINPWNNLFFYAERISKKLTGRNLSKQKKYPIIFDYWPAVIFFLTFSWLETNWSGASKPNSLAMALTTYTGIIFIGMWQYGRQNWLEKCECFTVTFRILGKFAITEGNLKANKNNWYLRPPGIGLYNATPAYPSLSMVIFILLLLSTVTYDGFSETEIFVLYNQVYFDLLNNAFNINEKNSETLRIFIGTTGLIFFPIIFFIVYLFFTWLIAFMNNETHNTFKLMRCFILSMVPIAIAYHLSHYFTLLGIEGQSLFRLISDPFGYGWNIFGTASYETDITIINAKFVWYFSAILIVTGHIVAVYIAHLEALRIYGDHPEGRKLAMISQIPMLFLMVGYTMLSLWIIAQPIVG